MKTNIPPNLLFTIAKEVIGSGDMEFVQGEVPTDGTWQYAHEGGRSVLAVNIKKNADYLAQILSWK